MSQSLTERYDDRIAGVLSCYDRLVITGTLPAVCYAAGMTGYLNANGIRIFDYPDFAKTLRERVRDRAAALAAEAGVTIEHIVKPHVRKEDVVARVLQQRGDRPGLVHVISAMEACDAYKPWHDKQTHKTFLRPDSGTCLHYYFYVLDAKFGLIYLCTAPGFLDTRLLLSGRPHDGLVPSCSGITGTAQAVLLDQPLGVVADDEVADGVTDFIDSLIDAAVHDLFLERAKEPFDHAIRLGFADEGVARRDAPEPDLLLEVVRHEVAAVIVAQRQAASGAGAEMAELLADRHADGLKSLEAGSAFGDVPAEQFGIPMLDDAEQPDLAILDAGNLGGVSRPHDIRRVGDDVPIVWRIVARAGAMRRQQGVLTHQPQHPFACHPDPANHPQPGPDFAVAFAGPGRACEIGFGPRRRGFVRHHGLRPPSPCRG